MSIDQFAALAGGLACLAVGCAWVALALLCFGVATGVIPSTWSSGPHGD